MATLHFKFESVNKPIVRYWQSKTNQLTVTNQQKCKWRSTSVKCRPVGWVWPLKRHRTPPTKWRPQTTKLRPRCPSTCRGLWWPKRPLSASFGSWPSSATSSSPARYSEEDCSHIHPTGNWPHYAKPKKHNSPLDIHWISLRYHTFKRKSIEIYRNL